jgi:hypothetical protein
VAVLSFVFICITVGDSVIKRGWGLVGVPLTSLTWHEEVLLKLVLWFQMTVIQIIMISDSMQWQ